MSSVVHGGGGMRSLRPGDRVFVPCPKCGTQQMVVRRRRRDGVLFLACLDAVMCRFSRDMPDDLKAGRRQRGLGAASVN